MVVMEEEEERLGISTGNLLSQLLFFLHSLHSPICFEIWQESKADWKKEARKNTMPVSKTEIVFYLFWKWGCASPAFLVMHV